MNYHLVIKPEAENDVLEIAKRYESKKDFLGIEFVDEIENKLKLIQNNPLHYQIRYKKTRFGLVKRFPFAIHFTIEGDKVIVLAVFATSQDPQTWK